jgi:hypothetical protein
MPEGSKRGLQMTCESHLLVWATLTFPPTLPSPSPSFEPARNGEPFTESASFRSKRTCSSRPRPLAQSEIVACIACSARSGFRLFRNSRNASRACARSDGRMQQLILGLNEERTSDCEYPVTDEASLWKEGEKSGGITCASSRAPVSVAGMCHS